MSMVISRHSPIISWSKQSANFQSFTELDRGGIQKNSNRITARRILVTSSDELDAQIILQNNSTNVYINRYILYNIYMEKDIFNIDKNKLSYGRGYVYSLQYHLVWCTKYRKKVLKNGIDTECEEMLQNLAEEYKFQILAMEVMPDHIHLLVDCKPQFYISDMIKIMKGNLARQMFLAYPELKKELWGGHLWNPSYCAITVSDRSRDQVLAYIEGQKEKEKKKA